MLFWILAKYLLFNLLYERKCEPLLEYNFLILMPRINAFLILLFCPPSLKHFCREAGEFFSWNKKSNVCAL